MRNYKDELVKYLKFKKHMGYVESQCMHLRNSICRQACKYGNVDIMGIVAGVGIQNENMRVELVYTDYEDISLTSSVARTGVTGNNKIEASTFS